LAIKSYKDFNQQFSMAARLEELKVSRAFKKGNRAGLTMYVFYPIFKLVREDKDNNLPASDVVFMSELRRS